MQAILKSKHAYFISWLEDAYEKGLLSQEQLHEFNKELGDLFQLYQEGRENIRRIVNRYEEKQKSIRSWAKYTKRMTERKSPLQSTSVSGNLES